MALGPAGLPVGAVPLDTGAGNGLGLTGSESNTDTSGNTVTVYQIDHTAAGAYFMPGADPGEGYANTNAQLFGTGKAPSPPVAGNTGFVTNYADAISYDQRSGRSVPAGTTASQIMGMFTPAGLPVLSGLAAGFAVCDHWYSSVPTETFPNRAFACAATSQGPRRPTPCRASSA